MLVASVPQYKIISFDTDGNILKIAKTPLENVDYIKVDQAEVELIANGTHSMMDYCVEYDFLEKEYKLKHVKSVQEEKTVSNFLYNIPDDCPTADIKIVKDNVNKEWRLQVNEEFLQDLQNKNITVDPTISFFSITQKDNPNVLYRLLKFDDSKTIKFSNHFEFDNNSFSVYTLKKFDTYCYEEVNE